MAQSGRYRAYPAYKPSGVEWLGDIPEGWTASRLKQVINQTRQITYGIVQAGPNIEGGIPYIRPADMTDEDGIRDFAGLLRTSPQIAAEYNRSKIAAGDIVCSIGPSFGKVMIVPSSLDGGNLTQGTARIAVDHENSARFLYWVLRSPMSFHQWESSIGGATFRALNLGPLAETNLALPSHSEQTQIAAFLDYETTKIDALIAKQERLIALLEEKRQAVISHAVTKGLNPNAPLRPSGIDWLGDVPAHWEVRAIKHSVSTPITDGPHETPNFVDEGIPFVSAEAVSSGEINFSKIRAHISARDHVRFSQKYAPKCGDIFLVKSGATTGKLAIVEDDRIFNIWSPLAAIRCRETISPRFILHFMRSAQFQEAIRLYWSFGTQQNIGMKVIENLHTTIPPRDEQNSIAEFLDNHVTKFEGLFENAQSAITLLKERRTALISGTVTGKIDVRDWQAPTDISTQDVSQDA